MKFLLSIFLLGLLSGCSDDTSDVYLDVLSDLKEPITGLTSKELRKLRDCSDRYEGLYKIVKYYDSGRSSHYPIECNKSRLEEEIQSGAVEERKNEQCGDSKGSSSCKEFLDGLADLAIREIVKDCNKKTELLEKAVKECL